MPHQKQDFTTSNVGRPKAWSKAQQRIIDKALPVWHEFSLVTHKELGGRNPILIAWKQQEMEHILAKDEFKTLPTGVSHSHRESCKVTDFN